MWTKLALQESKYWYSRTAGSHLPPLILFLWERRRTVRELAWLALAILYKYIIINMCILYSSSCHTHNTQHHNNNIVLMHCITTQGRRSEGKKIRTFLRRLRICAIEFVPYVWHGTIIIIILNNSWKQTIAENRKCIWCLVTSDPRVFLPGLHCSTIMFPSFLGYHSPM